MTPSEAGTLVVIVGPSPELEAEVRDAAAGYTVRVAPEVDAALDRARVERPAALVLSADLERGFAVCRRIKRDPALASLRLVLASARASDQELADHSRLPTRADAYLRLPAARADWAAALALPSLPPPLPDDALLFSLEVTPGDAAEFTGARERGGEPFRGALLPRPQQDLDLLARAGTRGMSTLPPAPDPSALAAEALDMPDLSAFDPPAAPARPPTTSGEPDDDGFDAILRELDPFADFQPPPPVIHPTDRWDLARETRLSSTGEPWALEDALADDHSGPPAPAAPDVVELVRSAPAEEPRASVPPPPPERDYTARAPVAASAPLTSAPPDHGAPMASGFDTNADVHPAGGRRRAVPEPEFVSLDSGLSAPPPSSEFVVPRRRAPEPRAVESWDPNAPPSAARTRAAPEAVDPEVTRLTTALTAARAEADVLRRERDETLGRLHDQQVGAQRAEEELRREVTRARDENEALRNGGDARAAEAKVAALEAQLVAVRGEAQRWRACHADAVETLRAIEELMSLAREGAARHAELAALPHE